MGVPLECAAWLLVSSSCVACGGAQDVDFWSQSTGESAPSAAGQAGASSAGASLGSSGAAGTAGSYSVAAGGTTITSAGAAGAAGTPPAGSVSPVVMKSLIDNMELEVSTIPEHDGRAGVWYTYNDGQGGQQLPASNGPFLPDLVDDGLPGSARARRTHGSGFAGFAGFGFDLNKHGALREAYDASAYSGITFWMRGSVNVRVLFPTRATAPTTQGGDCTSACNDSFGLDLAPNEAWSEHSVSFAALRQLGSSAAISFDPKTLLGVAFAVPASCEFDVWLDEIGFY